MHAFFEYLGNGTIECQQILQKIAYREPDHRASLKLAWFRKFRGAIADENELTEEVLWNCFVEAKWPNPSERAKRVIAAILQPSYLFSSRPPSLDQSRTVTVNTVAPDNRKGQNPTPNVVIYESSMAHHRNETSKGYLLAAGLAPFTNAPLMQATRGSIDFDSLRQTCAQNFKERKYIKVFETPEMRAAYVASYSPVRALCYEKLFKSDLKFLLVNSKNQSEQLVLCLGAGPAGEMVGISLAYLQLPKDQRADKLKLYLQDEFDYSLILSDIFGELDTQGGSIEWYLMMGNVVGRGPIGTGSVGDGVGGKVWDLILGSMERKVGAQLITACFIAIELFIRNKESAQRFFLRLTEAMQPGAYILVLDSPSYLNVGMFVWPHLDEIIVRDIPCDGGNDKMVKVLEKNGSYDGNEYLNDGTYNITKCNYTYRLYKKERQI